MHLDPSLLNSIYAPIVLFVFIIAYGLVIAEEFIDLNKSKTVVIAASIIWILIAYAARLQPSLNINEIILHYLAEFVDLFLFLLVAMAYVNVMDERGLFANLQQKFAQQNFSFRQFFWCAGIAAFVLSPVIDNLTTAIILGTLVISVKKAPSNFYTISIIQIVIAANAGGVFSPFGDITSLMIWQKGYMQTLDFVNLILPALLGFIIPACCMHYALPQGLITNEKKVEIPLKNGGIFITILFLLTIITTVLSHHYLHLPSSMGMMTGLGYLKLYAFYLNKRSLYKNHLQTINVFQSISNVKWDTLLFFYGMILCIGGLATLGYLSIAMNYLYANSWGHFSFEHSILISNTIIGLLSAIIDNIPVVYAILNMQPDMPLAQWQLVALTSGIGGSLLSIGSAAGVALMGTSKHYTFMSHFRWSWAILLGYFAAIASHYYLNFS